MWALTERLTPKEKQALIATTEMLKAEVGQWQKLEARARKLETALRSARIRKASQVYQVVSPAAPDELLFLMYHSPLKPVQERLRNYYQKYLPAIQEITAEEWAALEGKPGTPRHHKAREEFIANRLDRRPPRQPEAPRKPRDLWARPSRQPPRWNQVWSGGRVGKGVRRIFHPGNASDPFSYWIFERLAVPLTVARKGLWAWAPLVGAPRWSTGVPMVRNS